MNPDEERLVESENNSSASLSAAQEDPLFDRAVEIVLETKRGSVSLLQRRLAIGYTRASRLIDLMGIAKIIGEHKGSVAREVMITPEQWEEIKRLGEEELRRQEAGGEDEDGQQALFADGGALVETKPDDEEAPFDVSDQVSALAEEADADLDDSPEVGLTVEDEELGDEEYEEDDADEELSSEVEEDDSADEEVDEYEEDEEEEEEEYVDEADEEWEEDEAEAVDEVDDEAEVEDGAEEDECEDEEEWDEEDELDEDEYEEDEIEEDDVPEETPAKSRR